MYTGGLREPRGDRDVETETHTHTRSQYPPADNCKDLELHVYILSQGHDFYFPV